MPYRLTSLYSRIAYTAQGVIAAPVLFYLGSFGTHGSLAREGAVGWVGLAFGVLFLVRGPRCATVLSSEEKVIFRGLLFTKSWRWEQIDRFIVDARPVVVPLTFFTQRRRVMGVRTREGKSIWFTEISRRYAIGQPNVIDDNVDRLNEILASKRADFGHSHAG